MPRDTLAELDDEALLVLYANKDPDAARLLAHRLIPRLVGYAGRLLSDRAEAEDVAQETMLRLWKIAPIWRRGEAKVSTWAYRVAGNLCTDRLRGRQRRRSTALDDVAEAASDAAPVVTALIEADRMVALDAALANLPERQRSAVILRHIEGLTNPEIAEILQIGVEAVESLTARGKRALTLALSGQRADLGYKEAD